MRRVLALVVVPLLVVLASCGDDDGGGGSAEGGGEVRTTPIEFGEGDEVLLRVRTGGGFVPQIFNLREVPSLLLFDDGRLVRLVDNDDDGVLPQFESVQLDEAATAQLLDDFAAVVDGPDPGDPLVTDLPTTTIEVTTDGDTRDLAIYALSFEDESLSDAEQGAREAATEAIDDAFALDGGEPYVPEEWLVLTTAIGSDVGGATDPQAWPLEPERRAGLEQSAVCTRVTGEDRDLVLEALDDADAYVLVGEGRDLAEIALRPVLTGEESCDDVSDDDSFVER